MSSDFESLSCDEDDSRLSLQQQQQQHRQQHHHHRRRRDNTSGSFDALDDLVAEQDARLLRCLPMVRDSNYLRPGLHDDEDDDDEAAAYGHRAYGVTGPHHERRPPSASRSLLHRFVLPNGARTCQQQPSAPQSVCVSDKGFGKASGKTDGAAAVSAVSPSCGSEVRLFTQQRKQSPELSYSSRTTSCDTPAAAAASLLPPSILPTTVLAAEEHEAATQPMLCRQVQVQARYRTAADVDGGVEPASPVLPRPPDSLQSPSQQRPSRTWRATCPPDSGPITPATSHATLTASATTRRSSAGGDDDVGEKEDDRDDEREDNAPATLPTPAAVSAVESVPSPIPPPAHNAFHDADGFYRTRLLEDSTEEDKEEEQTGSGEHGDRDSHNGLQMQQRQQQQGTPLPVLYMNLSTTSEAPVDAQRTLPASAAAAAATGSQSSLLVSNSCAGVAVGPSAPSTTLRERLTVAMVELQRVAAALPHMTTVHVLSLIITILIPINVLCLDVMAFSWIRRFVDGRYREAMDAAPRPGGLGSELHNATGASTSATASCVASSSAAAAVAVRGRQMLPFSFFQSSRKCSTGAYLSATYQAGAPRGSVASLGSDARSGQHDGALSTDTHAVSTLCCFVMWLMFPNGALVRLLLLRRCKIMGEEGSDVIWASCLYARLRRSAPQLVVLELYVRYACLWAMVHTATLPEQWMPMKVNPETPWPLSSSASLASSVKARG